MNRKLWQKFTDWIWQNGTQLPIDVEKLLHEIGVTPIPILQRKYTVERDFTSRALSNGPVFEFAIHHSRKGSLIAYNKYLISEWQRVALSHGLGHILSDKFSNPHDQDYWNEYSLAEPLANVFAQDFLVPEEFFDKEATTKDLIQITKYFNVPFQFAISRLRHSCRDISFVHYYHFLDEESVKKFLLNPSSEDKEAHWYIPSVLTIHPFPSSHFDARRFLPLGGIRAYRSIELYLPVRLNLGNFRGTNSNSHESFCVYIFKDCIGSSPAFIEQQFRYAENIVRQSLTGHDVVWDTINLGPYLFRCLDDSIYFSINGSFFVMSYVFKWEFSKYVPRVTTVALIMVRDNKKKLWNAWQDGKRRLLIRRAENEIDQVTERWLSRLEKQLNSNTRLSWEASLSSALLFNGHWRILCT